MNKSEYTHFTVNELTKFLRVTSSTIYSWIKKGKVNALKESNSYSIISDDKLNAIISDHTYREYKYETYVPNELKDYEYWHQFLDNFTWLIKISYSTKEDIKKKKFRLDTIFQRYLMDNSITLKKVKGIYNSPIEKKEIICGDLNRGWYNELAFVYPLKNSTLGLSFKDIELNYEVSSERFLFPSWSIVKAYYSIYFYLRSISLMKNPTFRIQEHKSSINTFKNSLLPKLKERLWKFPFNIEYKPGVRVYRNKTFLNKLDYKDYEYCKHPRPPYLSPAQLFEEVYKTYSKRGKSFRRPSHYTLFDFFLEFRIWGNYLDIDNLLALYGKGYKGFLDQNISLILFIIAGISEISTIAKQGEDEYLNLLQKFYDLFALNNSTLKNSFTNTPMYQRMKIYQSLGFISNEISLKLDKDINEVEYVKK